MDEVSSAGGVGPAGSQLYTAAGTKGRADLQLRELHGGVGDNTSPPADDKCPSCPNRGSVIFSISTLEPVVHSFIFIFSFFLFLLTRAGFLPGPAIKCLLIHKHLIMNISKVEKEAGPIRKKKRVEWLGASLMVQAKAMLDVIHFKEISVTASVEPLNHVSGLKEDCFLEVAVQK